MQCGSVYLCVLSSPSLTLTRQHSSLLSRWWRARCARSPMWGCLLGTRVPARIAPCLFAPAGPSRQQWSPWTALSPGLVLIPTTGPFTL